MKPDDAAEPRTCPDELWELGAKAVDLARDWATRAAGEPVPTASRLLAGILRDEDGVDFTLRFVDDVIRSRHDEVAAAALTRLAARPLPFLPVALRAAVKSAGAAARLTSGVTMAAVRRAFREVVGDLVLDANNLGPALRRVHAHGNHVNVNLLGEAVLGAAEAARRLQLNADLLERGDVDYLSLKVSSVIGPHNPFDFDGAVERAVATMLPFFRRAKANGTFLNLDMESYPEVDLTIAVFKRVLEDPSLHDYRAGIVLQAYLPDAFAEMQGLQEWAAARVAKGGAPIKVRLVKGANLAMERVEAEMRGWPPVTWPTKEQTDTHYKRILAWAMTPGRIANVHLGIAGHNLFDIAFAHLLAEARGLGGRAETGTGIRALEFELLAGMASGQAAVLGPDLGPLRMYVPVVKPAEFDVAIAYLVRRLEENSAPENFMSGIFEVGTDPAVFARERDRFLRSLSAVDGAVPLPNRTQDRRAAVPDEAGEEDEFRNTPDTDPSLPGNRAWAREIAARIPASRLGEDAAGATPLTSADDVDALVARMRDAGAAWAARPAADRAAVLRRVAEVLEERRGELLEVAGAEAGKTIDQSDTEVSEAIDFANWYGRLALDLEDLDGARFVPARLTVVTPPWNFPLAIPAGGMLAALAAGSAVVLKPATPARRCGAELARAMWDAGVPRDVLALVDRPARDVAKSLIVHEGVERVVLTGSYDTASLFRSWRPDLHLLAETSGKNAIVVTPSADPDLAVRDIVTSAFGHAGQKCSAASLVVLVSSMANDARFRDQLVDAIRSLRVGLPQDLTAQVGPVVLPDDEKLRRGLTQLGEGEHWVVAPRPLDDEGRLWQPGLRAGVRIDSEFHLTEYFGPILGIMTAPDLGSALEIVNGVEYGLTSGLHSLDPEEVVYWLERVHAGNLYVNRGITGAIVRRQPFGGWKRSAIGPGTKAGGPNYLLGFGTFEPVGSLAETAGERPASPHSAAARAPKLSAVPSRVRPLLRATKSHVSKPQWRSLRRAAASDGAMWDARYGRNLDPSHLTAEVNLLRYRPLPVTIRVGSGGSLRDVTRVVAAGAMAGSILTLSHGIPLPRSVQGAMRTLRVTVRPESDDEWLVSAAQWAASRPLDGRIRLVSSDASALARAIGGNPDIAVWDHQVTESGQVEMLPFLHEQSISITGHRFGTPVRLVELPGTGA